MQFVMNWFSDLVELITSSYLDTYLLFYAFLWKVWIRAENAIRHHFRCDTIFLNCATFFFFFPVTVFWQKVYFVLNPYRHYISYFNSFQWSHVHTLLIFLVLQTDFVVLLPLLLSYDNIFFLSWWNYLLDQKYTHILNYICCDLLFYLINENFKVFFSFFF